LSKKLFYRIGEACKLLDIQPYVLRYWETEFPVLSPRKSKAGQRVYSEEELQLIQRIKQLLYEEGYTIAGAKKKLESELVGEPGSPTLANGAAEPPAAKAGARRRAEAARQTAAAADAVESAEESAAAAAAASEEEADAEVPEPASKATKVARAVPAHAAATAGAAPVPSLDTGGGQQVERLRTGLQEALAEARDILRLLTA
jgi:DNA-binding transcriptional MerR regulator